MPGHKPERSRATKISVDHVFKGQRHVSHLGQAKAGRAWNLSERKPQNAPRPKTR